MQWGERAQGSELPGGKDKGWACWLVGKGQMEEGGREEEKRMLADAGSGGSGVRGCSSHTSGSGHGGRAKQHSQRSSGCCKGGEKMFSRGNSWDHFQAYCRGFFPCGVMS